MFSDVLGKYSTAVRQGGTDKTTTHSYGPLYDELTRGWRDTPVDILEIGVQHGPFLHALAEYLPHARIVGMDIDASRLDPHLDWTNPRITVHEVDATTPEALGVLPSDATFDLIVEDASHLPEHQKAHLDLFAPRLKPGGTYVIEDIDGMHERWLHRDLGDIAAKHGLRMTWKDLRHAKGRYDDILAVFTAPLA